MVLKNINLRIAKNETVALVGESGVGKTTLVNLILRFYDVTEASITLDGIDIRDMKPQLPREQHSPRHAGRDPLQRYRRQQYHPRQGSRTCGRVEAAIRSAYAHDFISKLPKKLDTVVGEKGVRLSGGQKQRIAIARALYKDAPILILDEATSALDTASETEVQKALENLMKGRTTIIIAHRLSTIINADRIIVLEDGGIVQQGTHRELIEAEGPYKRLYEMQFRDEPQKKVIRIDKRLKNV